MTRISSSSAVTGERVNEWMGCASETAVDFDRTHTNHLKIMPDYTVPLRVHCAHVARSSSNLGLLSIRCGCQWNVPHIVPAARTTASCVDYIYAAAKCKYGTLCYAPYGVWLRVTVILAATSWRQYQCVYGARARARLRAVVRSGSAQPMPLWRVGFFRCIWRAFGMHCTNAGFEPFFRYAALVIRWASPSRGASTAAASHARHLTY